MILSIVVRILLWDELTKSTWVNKAYLSCYRLNALADGFHKATSEVQDAIDGMLCELTHLNNQIDNAEPIASTVPKIMDQIQENKVWFWTHQ